MKFAERLILIVVAAIVLAAAAAGLSVLRANRERRAAAITRRDLAQAAAADPNGPQMSLWRTDPGQSTMLFGKAVKTGAFNLPERGSLTLRALVIERGGGFTPDAIGKIHVARKVDGQIKTIAEATRAQMEDPTWTDMVIQAGDVVYAE